MRLSIGKKREAKAFKAAVTVMSHDSICVLGGSHSSCARENAAPSLSGLLKVTTKYWSEIRQAAEITQETRQINSSVLVMSHSRRGELTGLEPFCGLENVQSASHRGVLLDANAFFLHPSLSRNLTGKIAITESRSRCRRASLPLAKSFLAEAHWARSASCVVSDVPAAAMDADAPRLHADKQQHLCLIASRPRDGITSRMPTQPRAPRGLEAHTE